MLAFSSVNLRPFRPGICCALRLLRGAKDRIKTKASGRIILNTARQTERGAGKRLRNREKKGTGGERLWGKARGEAPPSPLPFPNNLPAPARTALPTLRPAVGPFYGIGNLGLQVS